MCIVNQMHEIHISFYQNYNENPDDKTQRIILVWKDRNMEKRFVISDKDGLIEGKPLLALDK